MERFTDKVVLVTGGTSGIGLAAAELFRDEGATVVVTGSSAESTVRAGALGFDAVRSDTAKLSDITALIEEVGARHGRIDVLFVNAGIPGPPHRVTDADEAVFDTIVGVNLKGVFFTVQKALPLIPKGGAIVLTSSVGASRGMPGGTLYSATKAGVRALGRGFAAELMPRRIRVNVLTPGLTDTPIFDKMGVPAEIIKTKLAELVPMGRAGSPAEVARAALFLASDDASFMTGTETVVAGGQLDL